MQDVRWKMRSDSDYFEKESILELLHQVLTVVLSPTGFCILYCSHLAKQLVDLTADTIGFSLPNPLATDLL